MKLSSKTLLLAFLLVSLGMAQTVSYAPRSLDKKFIEYGWGSLNTPIQEIEKNIAQMEEMPFDGMIFTLSQNNVLELKELDPVKFEADLQACANIKWNKFTDNFLVLLAASDLDWFNDEHWELILEKAKQFARAARVARAKGICFDQEPYGTNPWCYLSAAHRRTKSFTEYEAIVRKRGAQFIQALESEMPGLTILTFFQLSYYTKLLRPMAAEERAKLLEEHGYAFIPAFLNGMLDAASEKVEIIDGNEGAYGYVSKNQYFEMYNLVHNQGAFLIDSVNHEKYRKQVKMGRALYVDLYFGDGIDGMASYLDPQGQENWFLHNIYWSLKTTEKYVWCYSEHMNWWKNEPLTAVPKGVPPKPVSELAEVIRKARRRYDTGYLDSGFDEVFAPIWEKKEQERLANIHPETVEIARLKKDVARPVVDGKLDDPAWAQAAELVPFSNLPFYNSVKEPKANTAVRVTYDEENLYFSFLCQEPEMANMTLLAEKRDDNRIYMRDNVVFLLVAENSAGKPIKQFIFNPDGLAWEAEYRAQSAFDPEAYNPEYEIAATKNADNWTVEVAIPWKAFGLSMPEPGTVYRGDFCRQREVGGLEITAWSPGYSSFMEHEYYGIFKFVE